MAEISGDNVLDGKLVTRLCQILNSAGVPNLLWGNYLLTIYGIPTIIDVSTFLSSDGITTKFIVGFGPCYTWWSSDDSLVRSQSSGLSSLHREPELPSFTWVSGSAPFGALPHQRQARVGFVPEIGYSLGIRGSSKLPVPNVSRYSQCFRLSTPAGSSWPWTRKIVTRMFPCANTKCYKILRGFNSPSLPR